MFSAWRGRTGGYSSLRITLEPPPGRKDELIPEQAGVRSDGLVAHAGPANLGVVQPIKNKGQGRLPAAQAAGE